VSALPGVVSAACTDVVPLSEGGRRDEFHVEGRPNTGRPDPGVELYMASAGYFETMGIPRVAGRDFANETAAGPKVAVVNQAFADRVFKNENAIGQRVTGGGATYEIVGVVKNIKSRTLARNCGRFSSVRSSRASAAIHPSWDMRCWSVQRALRRRWRRRAAGDSCARSRRWPSSTRKPWKNTSATRCSCRGWPAHYSACFGLESGLLLAAIGLYGVMSYSVSRRTREIGIRMALGAQTGAVRRLVMRQGMLLTLIAVALGLAAAWAMAKFSAGFLYGVSRTT
jgi:hypothetical protein